MIAWELQKRLGSVPINFVAVHSIRAMIRDGREVLENMSRIGDRPARGGACEKPALSMTSTAPGVVWGCVRRRRA